MLRRAIVALSGVLMAVAACQSAEGDVRAVDDTTTSTRRTTSTTPTTTTTTTPRAQPAATTTTTRPPSPPITAQPTVLPFAASIETVTAQDLYASWRPGCPVPVEQLRAIDVRHFGNDGAVHTGRVIVHANLAAGLVEVFRDLYRARFPIERMEPID